MLALKRLPKQVRHPRPHIQHPGVGQCDAIEKGYSNRVKNSLLSQLYLRVPVLCERLHDSVDRLRFAR